MKFLQKIWPNPLHCFLLPVFFILHNYIDFYGLVQLQLLLTDLIIWLAAPLLLFLLLFTVYRNASKAGLLCTLLLFFYFFGASVQQFLQKLPVFGNVFKQSFFIIYILLISIFLFLRLASEKKIVSAKIHLYLSVCLLLLIAYDISSFATKNKKQLKQQNLLIQSGIPVLKAPGLTTSLQKPDIYFFIFDMHGSSNSFQKIFQFNNHTLDSGLIQSGFSLAPNSSCASNYTLTSMASLFSMTQLPLANKEQLSFREMYRARNSIANNPVVPFLKQEGYSIINASPFPLFKDDTTFLFHIGWGQPEELIKNQTLFRSVQKTVSWLFEKYFPAVFQSAEYKVYRDDLITIKKSLQRVERTILKKDTTKPRFVYSHLFIPHEPFKFDSSGKIIPWSKDMYLNQTAEQYFIQQLIYCRKLILKLAADIQKKNARPAVIIFQGDHGYRVNQQSANANEVFNVLNAIYFPEEVKPVISDSFYTPNTFRLILNRYFQQQLPMLPAKSTMIQL